MDKKQTLGNERIIVNALFERYNVTGNIIINIPMKWLSGLILNVEVQGYINVNIIVVHLYSIKLIYVKFLM